MPYFDQFPTISYSNVAVRDISRRVVVGTVPTDPRSYLPYEVKSHDRPDTVAAGYYGDPTAYWLVWLSIGAIDPYYAWPLDDDTFQAHVAFKYGSIERAQAIILGWRVNWADAPQEVTAAYFSTNLPDPLRKYFEPVFGEGSEIIFYQRRVADWETVTNMIVSFSAANGLAFSPGDWAQLKRGNTVLANVQVAFANSSYVIGRHVLGDTTNVSSAYLYGIDTGANSAVTASGILANCIPIDERVYWEPVYAMDDELEKNATRKQIFLVDSRFQTDVTNSLRQLLQANLAL